MASYADTENRQYGEHTLPLPENPEQPVTFELIDNPKLRNRLGGHLLRSLLFRLCPFTRHKSRFLVGDTYLQRVAQADLVLDLSGFALSDQRSLKRRLTFCAEILCSRWLGTRHVLFTQAFGPFRHPVTRALARFTLPQASLIIARGQQTLVHLSQLGLPQKMEIPVCSDSAFLLPPASPEAAEQILEQAAPPSGLPLFGIIPNMQVYHRSHRPDGRNSYIDLLAEAARYARSTFAAQVVFLCHEHDEHRKDDEWLTRQILAHDPSLQDSIIIPGTHSAPELKAIIGRFDFVLASRFHSIVAAISTSTPFLVVGWAHKYQELVADIGMAQSVFDVSRQFSADDLLQAIDKGWRQRETTRQQLQQHARRLQADADRAFQLVQHYSAVLTQKRMI